MQRCILEQFDIVDRCVEELKEGEGRVLTNCYLDPEEGDRLTKAGRLELEYKEGAWLNLYCRDDGFFRLYYYLLSPEGYTAEADGTLIADLFYRNGSRPDPARNAEEALQKAGFAATDTYSRWNRKVEEDPERKADPDIGTEADEAFLTLLYSCFDKYKDCLPLREEWEQYLAEHQILRYPAQGDMAGGVVWKKKGSVVTEEYIFTAPAQRGRKIGSYLHEQLCAAAFGEEKGKLIAWVNETNAASQALHTSCGYTKDNMKKTVFRKG